MAPAQKWLYIHRNIALDLWFFVPTKPAKGPCLTHRSAWFAAWRRNAVPQLQRVLRLATVGVPLACDLARSGSNPGAAFFQVEMRQPVYDGGAADRTQAVLLQGFQAL